MPSRVIRGGNINIVFNINIDQILTTEKSSYCENFFKTIHRNLKQELTIIKIANTLRNK